MEAPETLQNAIVYFSDPDRCFQYALNLRWPNGVVSCPRCGSEKHSFIKTRRIWFCKAARSNSRSRWARSSRIRLLGLDKWMCAFWMICNCKNGVSSCEIARSLGITQKSAWFMLHRIRKAMHEDVSGPMGGEVEAGRNVHRRQSSQYAHRHAERRITGTGGKGKAVAFGLLERGGKVRTIVLPDRAEGNRSTTDQKACAGGSSALHR